MSFGSKFKFHPNIKKKKALGRHTFLQVLCGSFRRAASFIEHLLAQNDSKFKTRGYANKVNGEN